MYMYDLSPQPSFVSKPSPKSINSLIGEARLPSLHHLDRILWSKNDYIYEDQTNDSQDFLSYVVISNCL